MLRTGQNLQIHTAMLFSFSISVSIILSVSAIQELNKHPDYTRDLNARIPARFFRDLPNSETVCFVIIEAGWKANWVTNQINKSFLESLQLSKLPPVEAIGAEPVFTAGFQGGFYPSNTFSERPFEPRWCKVECGDTRPGSRLGELDGANRQITAKSARSASVGYLECPPGQEVRFGTRFSIRDFDDGEDLDKRPAQPALVPVRKCWCVIVSTIRDFAYKAELEESASDSENYLRQFNELLNVALMYRRTQEPPIRDQPLGFQDMRNVAMAMRQQNRATHIDPALLEAAIAVQWVSRRQPQSRVSIPVVKTPMKPKKKRLTKAAIRLQAIADEEAARELAEVEASMTDLVAAFKVAEAKMAQEAIRHEQALKRHDAAEASAAADAWTHDGAEAEAQLGRWMDWMDHQRPSVEMTAMFDPTQAAQTRSGGTQRPGKGVAEPSQDPDHQINCYDASAYFQDPFGYRKDSDEGPPGIF